jgi:hypothetical protein
LTHLDIAHMYNLTDTGLEYLKNLNLLNFLNIASCLNVTDLGKELMERLLISRSESHFREFFVIGNVELDYVRRSYCRITSVFGEVAIFTKVECVLLLENMPRGCTVIIG